MITNEEDIEIYEAKNKIYIPEDYNKNNWKYTINNDTITIITNENCYNQYNSTYCDCRQFNMKYNLITEPYSCNSNPTNQLINNSYITSDINDSIKITNDYVKQYEIWFNMLIIIVLLTLLFKKNSRRI